MIVLLHQRDNKDVAETMRSDMLKAFNGHIDIALHGADESNLWPRPIEWDDLLIVVFDEKAFPKTGNDFIEDYLQKRTKKGLLLPVALNPARTHPPTAAEALKALVFDSAAPGVAGRLVNRAGAMIGLRVQQRENEVFISYRASDGKEIATQLEEHLKGLGYPVWRDEAKDIDDLTKILPGTLVQNQIDEALAKASILLLVDTPDAPHSRWITHEVDTANGILLPILPLCFRPVGDHKHGPRFPSLLQRQRWVSLPLPTGVSPPLQPDQLDSIIIQMEEYLCQLVQRKCRVPALVGKEFLARSFTWDLLDKKLLVGESVKGAETRFPTRVLSHCSIFDHVHAPGMKAFSDFMSKLGRPNFSLYIYDGEMIPEPQLIEFIQQNPSKDNVFILHHQELSALIDSNFALKVL